MFEGVVDEIVARTVSGGGAVDEAGKQGRLRSQVKLASLVKLPIAKAKKARHQLRAKVLAPTSHLLRTKVLLPASLLLRARLQLLAKLQPPTNLQPRAKAPQPAKRLRSLKSQAFAMTVMAAASQALVKPPQSFPSSSSAS